MFRRVLSVILGAAAQLNLGLSGDKLREMIITALTAMQTAAALTPQVWDDLVLRLAIAMIKSDAWTLLLEVIRRQLPVMPIGAPADVETAAIPAEASYYSDADLTAMLQAEFAIVERATAA